MNAIDIANYLLFVTSDVCSDVTNMKINKLVYFAQGHALQQGFSLFSDDIRAGEHGPIIETVYHHYEDWGNKPITEWDEAGAKVLPENIKDFLIEIAKVYSQYTTSQLRWMTHQPNTPWKEYYHEGGRYRVIPTEAIEDYFKNNVSPLGDDDYSDFEFIGYRDDDGYLVLPAEMR